MSESGAFKILRKFEDVIQVGVNLSESPVNVKVGYEFFLISLSDNVIRHNNPLMDFHPVFKKPRLERRGPFHSLPIEAIV